jgi:hypothetical protein
MKVQAVRHHCFAGQQSSPAIWHIHGTVKEHRGAILYERALHKQQLHTGGKRPLRPEPQSEHHRVEDVDLDNNNT